MLVIGERVNATRKKIKQAIESHDSEYLAAQIRLQQEAGADCIDLNVGTGAGSREREAADMQWLVELALEHTSEDLCIDSADPAVIAAAAERIGGRRGWLLNSIKGTAESLETLLPLVERHRVPFIALAMDEDGIARDVEGRLRVCRKVFDRTRERGIDPSLVLFDPLVMPQATDVSQARVTCECIRRIKEGFAGVRTVVGLSNVSHGLPMRDLVNRGFLIAAMLHGLDAALIDPTRKDMRIGLAVGKALAGLDRHCRGYCRASRRGQLTEKERS